MFVFGIRPRLAWGMSAETRVPPRRRPRLFYGWWMALSGMYLMFYTTGVSFFGFSAFFDSIRLDLNWTREQVSRGPAMMAVFTAILSPTIGALTDRFGPRLVTAVAMFSGGAGFIVLSQVEHAWQYYVAFVLIGSGMGATSYVMVATAISNWFLRNRGKALGLTFMGPGFGGIMTALLVVLIGEYGWRDAALFTGIGTWVTCIPLAMVLRRRPEHYGLRMDGDPPETDDSESGQAGDPADAEPSPGAVRSILLSRSYLLYVGALSMQQVAITAMVVHHIPALVSYGFSMETAGAMVVVFTVASIPMRFFSGALADRFNKKLVVATMLSFQLAGGILFIFIANIWVAIIFEVIYGTGWGGSNAARLSLQGDYWGRGIFGSLMGLQVGAGAVGGLISPVLVGWLADAYDYRIAFMTVVVPLALAVIMVLLMTRPPRGAVDTVRLAA